MMSNPTHSHPLKSPPFKWLWLGQAISTFGNRFTTIAVPLFIYNLTGSSAQLGAAFVTQVLAALLFGLVAGAYTDRWDRRRTMLVCDLLRAALIALIPLSLLLDITQPVRIGIIYLLSFCVAAVGQFFDPAKISLIPKTVAQDQLVVANSLDQATSNFMQSVGYSLAGVLIFATNVSMAFIVDALTFVLSALCIFMIRVEVAEQDKDKKEEAAELTKIADSIRLGLRHLWQIPSLRWLLLVSFIAPIGIGAIQPLTVIFVQDTLGLNEVSYGLWQAAIAIGIVIGVVAIGRFAPHAKRSHLISFGVIAFGLFHALAIIAPTQAMRLELLSGEQLLLVALPLVVLVAAGNGSIFLGIRTMVQENTPNEMIGRVYSAITVVGSLAIAIGQVSSGLADLFSATGMILFWSLFMLAVGLGSLAFTRHLGTAEILDVVNVSMRD